MEISKINILGIDLGRRGGWAVNVNGIIKNSGIFLFTSYQKAYDFFSEIVDNWKIDVIITAKVNLRGHKFVERIAYSHLPFVGILCLISEKKGIKCVYENSDMTMRAKVLGKGNGKNKKLVQDTYNGITPDVSDAILFTHFWFFNGEKR